MRRKRVLLNIFIFFCMVCITMPFVSAQIHNITIGTDTLYCGESDDICPSDYASCQGCIDDAGDAVNDPDCCSSTCSGFWCTSASVVCGDSSNEETIHELDSEGELATSSTAEDCFGTCTPGTEHVIDSSDEPACADSYYDGTDLGYDYTFNCADDGVLYRPYTYTSSVCVEDISCHDTDDDGDLEVCDEGKWHDADESLEYCTASAKSWIETEIGTDVFNDDYNGVLDDGYCDGDDGYILRGAVIGETYRGSSYCEALEDATITIKDVATATTIYDTDTTEYSETWTYETLTCHDGSADNSVGQYSLTLEAGTYYLIAEKAGYNTVTRTITVTGDQTLSSFWMYLNAECQSDCTMNDRICYAECAGVNGCTYSDYGGTSIAPYCDGLQEGYRYVLTESEGEDSIYGDEVYCCNNEPQSYEREYFTAGDVATNCVENVIEHSKAITVNGELVDIHFVLFSDPQAEKTGCSEYADYACEVYGDAFC
jgi:hypothetical protein